MLLSAFIVRLRTVAERDTVTARSLLGSETVRWEDIDGLASTRASWARAQLKDGRELPLPAVTFATLPQLTEASAGRVPNPVRLSALRRQRVAPVEEHPQRDAAADADQQRGERADERPAGPTATGVQPVPPGSGEDDRDDGDDQDDLVFVPVGEEIATAWPRCARPSPPPAGR